MGVESLGGDLVGLLNKIKNWFRKGGEVLGTAETLDSVLDHPKINGDPKEYDRIKVSLMHYEGNYPKVKYLNSNKQLQDRDLSSINMMKKVANQYATMVFNEQCEINVDGEASEFIQEVFEHNDFKKNFSKYLEPMFALGGLACRPYFDADSKQIEFSWALANAFYPLQSNTNNISECAIPFVSTRTEGKKTYYYTLLEFHEWKDESYVVTNELYRSEDSSRVGSRVPLKELYDDLEEETPFKDLSRPQFTYLKTSGFNNINPYSPLGLGVCDNCKKTLDRINRVYDEFDQEIKKGKRRVAVTDMLLNSRINRETQEVVQFFDEDEDTFIAIPGSNMDDYTVKDLTTNIRTTEYIGAINHQLKTLEMETNLSTGTFTFDMNGVRSTKTATEVVSENSQTYQTRSMQITEIEKFVKELIVSVCELGKAMNIYTSEIPKYDQIGIDFNDGAFQNRDAQLNFYMKLVNLGYPVEKVFQAVLDLPEEEAKKLAVSGLRRQADVTSGMFTSAGLPNEDE